MIQKLFKKYYQKKHDHLIQKDLKKRQEFIDFIIKNNSLPEKTTDILTYFKNKNTQIIVFETEKSLYSGTPEDIIKKYIPLPNKAFHIIKAPMLPKKIPSFYHSFKMPLSNRTSL